MTMSPALPCLTSDAIARRTAAKGLGDGWGPRAQAIWEGRVRDALNRQHELSDDVTFTIGPYHFKPSAKMLVSQATNRRLHLTEKETAILKYLYRTGDKPVPREVLLDEVWGYNAGVTTHTLETHIYRLRQKIEPEPGRTQLLVTEPGGYRLVR